jgi:hypothetical protein
MSVLPARSMRGRQAIARHREIPGGRPPLAGGGKLALRLQRGEGGRRPPSPLKVGTPGSRPRANTRVSTWGSDRPRGKSYRPWPCRRAVRVPGQWPGDSPASGVPGGRPPLAGGGKLARGLQRGEGDRRPPTMLQPAKPALLGLDQPLRLVLYVDGDLRQRSGVLTAVMRTEEQLSRVWEQDADVRLRTATIAQIEGGQRLCGGYGSSQRRLPLLSASGSDQRRRLAVCFLQHSTTPVPASGFPAPRCVRHKRKTALDRPDQRCRLPDGG